MISTRCVLEKAVRDLANAAPVIQLSARKTINLETWNGMVARRDC